MHDLGKEGAEHCITQVVTSGSLSEAYKRASERRVHVPYIVDCVILHD